MRWPAALLLACACDAPPVKHEVAITCMPLCDGHTSSLPIGSLCGDDADVAQALVSSEAQCLAALGQCTARTCTCVASPDPPECP
jgi:hypothetical protein